MLGFVLVTAGVCMFAPAPGDTPTPAAVVADRSDNRTRAYLLAQAELATSKDVLAAALRRKGIADLKVVAEQTDPVRWLKETVQVGMDEKNSALRIRIPVGSLKARIALANAIAETLVEQSARKFRAPVEDEIYERTLQKEIGAQTLGLLKAALNKRGAKDPARMSIEREIKDINDGLSSVEERLSKLRDELGKSAPMTLVEAAREPESK